MANKAGISRPKAIVFDFMGTCLDWRSGIHSAFREVLDDEVSMKLANSWRLNYFRAVRNRTDAGLPPADIDVTHRQVLDSLLADNGIPLAMVGAEQRQRLVRQWHSQTAWPDMAPALARLAKSFDVMVHANGTTRLQIDLVRSSGLHFHNVVSSEMLGVSKPDPENYRRGAKLFKLQPHEIMTVASHAWDVDGAKAVGMQTAHIWRDTEDLNEDKEDLKQRYDYFVDGRGGGDHVGIAELADILLQQ